jgi:hypothetical protein
LGSWGSSARASCFLEPPRPRDRHLIRASILYRFLKQKITKAPAWWYLSSATAFRDRPEVEPKCNAIVRDLDAEHAGAVLFVDLDRSMTGTMNGVFRDLVHVNEEGRRFKAEAIGRAILADVGGAGSAHNETGGGQNPPPVTSTGDRRPRYTTPCSSIASATLRKPAMFAPAT